MRTAKASQGSRGEAVLAQEGTKGHSGQFELLGAIEQYIYSLFIINNLFSDLKSYGMSRMYLCPPLFRLGWRPRSPRSSGVSSRAKARVHKHSALGNQKAITHYVDNL
jgi:hypothetical protein